MRSCLRCFALPSLYLTLALLAGAAQAEIVLGQSAALSGPTGDSGRGLSLGVAVAIAEANKAGGIQGEPLRLALLDDQGKPAQTLANTRSLISQEKASLLLGYHGNHDPSELARLLAEQRIALVGSGSGAAQVLSQAGPYAFHLRTGYQGEVEKMVSLLVDKLSMRRVALLAQDDDFGVSVQQLAQQALRARGLAPFAQARLDGDGQKAGAAAQSLAKVGADAVLLLAQSRPAGLFVQHFRAAGGTAQLYNLSSANYEEIVQLVGGDQARGVGIAQVYPYPADTRLKLVRDYQAAMRAHAPKSAKLSYASIEGYIAGRTAIEALRRAGKGASREVVVQALAGLNDFDLGGFVLDFDAERRVGSRFVELTMISANGNLTR